MASTEARYKLSVAVILNKEGEEFKMNQSTVDWNNLPYAGAVQLQELLIEALQETAEWGYDQAELIGQSELVAAARAAKARRKGRVQSQGKK